MVTGGLFEVEEADPGRKHQACDKCLTAAWASDDALRVRGWYVYDGKSQTGRDLHVRICRKCRNKGARS